MKLNYRRSSLQYRDKIVRDHSNSITFVTLRRSPEAEGATPTSSFTATSTVKRSSLHMSTASRPPKQPKISISKSTLFQSRYSATTNRHQTRAQRTTTPSASSTMVVCLPTSPSITTHLKANSLDLQFGRLTHYAFDAILVSAFLAGVKRSTGLT